MHRFYLPPEQCNGPVLFLTGREAHHATHVLRLSKDETVVVLDGAGREVNCVVQECGRDQLSLRVIGIQPAAPLHCEITLVQAIPKGKIIETIIQKATELGAARIVPLLSERVVTRLTEREAVQKAGKWQGVAVEAIKQCGAPWLPRIERPISLADFLSRKEKFDLALVASLHDGSREARDLFDHFRMSQGRSPRSVRVWVGPEGDFTPAEITSITASGASPISLGPLVLRCETAATYCLSIINHEIRWKIG